MARDIVGSPVKLTIDGLTLPVAADADPKDGKPKYKNEAISTTGGTVRKMTIQPQPSEAWKVIVNGDYLELLKAIAEKIDPVTMSYVTRAGDVYRSEGFISMEGRQQQSGEVEIVLHPINDWTYFGG